MHSTTLLLAISLAPAFVSAGLFPANGPVKMLTASTWKKVMSEERTSMVAFIAPWCGHCKNLEPEFTNACKQLAPMIPFYAVDCDDKQNQQLCAEQGVKGFPTIKSFHRGLKAAPHDYQGEREVGPIVEFMKREVPHRVTVLKTKDQIKTWLQKDQSTPHALLLTAKTSIPVTWKVLQNKYNKKITFAAAKDTDRALAKSFGTQPEVEGGPVILVWPVGATGPTIYRGTAKFEPMDNFLAPLADGTFNAKAREEL